MPVVNPKGLPEEPLLPPEVHAQNQADLEALRAQLYGTNDPAEKIRAAREEAWDRGLQDYLAYLNGRGKTRPPYPKNPYRKEPS